MKPGFHLRGQRIRLTVVNAVQLFENLALAGFSEEGVFYRDGGLHRMHFYPTKGRPKIYFTKIVVPGALAALPKIARMGHSPGVRLSGTRAFT